MVRPAHEILPIMIQTRWDRVTWGHLLVWPAVRVDGPAWAPDANANKRLQVDASEQRRCRRRMLRAVLSVAFIPMAVGSGPAMPGKATKAVLRYQDYPRNGEICADCWAYVAGPSEREGSCTAVQGPIRATGWCIAYSVKQPMTI